MEEIFLSASVPVEGRSYFKDADPLMIHAAVRSFAALVLARRRIVWGGHPSITPMLWAVCESLGVQYSNAVVLYQSRFFQDRFPAENKRFKNVKFISSKGDRESSLLALREAMFKRKNLRSAVFIGGMDGVATEFELYRRFHPEGSYVLVASPGGAACVLAKKYEQLDEQSGDPFDFTGLFIRKLKVSANDRRRAFKSQG